MSVSQLGCYTPRNLGLGVEHKRIVFVRRLVVQSNSRDGLISLGYVGKPALRANLNVNYHYLVPRGGVVARFIIVNKNTHFRSHVCLKQRRVSFIECSYSVQLVPVQGLVLTSLMAAIGIAAIGEGFITRGIVPQVDDRFFLIYKYILIHIISGAAKVC